MDDQRGAILVGHFRLGLGRRVNIGVALVAGHGLILGLRDRRLAPFRYSETGGWRHTVAVRPEAGAIPLQ